MKTRINIIVALFLVLTLMSATAFHWVPILEEIVGVAWYALMTTPVDGPYEPIIDNPGGW